MNLITLPVEVTRWLNALTHGSEPQEWSEDLQAELSRVACWLNEQAAADNAEGANLQFLLEQLKGRLDTAEVSELCRLFSEFYGLYEAFRWKRGLQRLAPNAAVNSAMQTLLACADGSQPLEALQAWTAPLEGYLNQAWEHGLVRGISSEETGLTAFAQGLREWKERLAAGQANPEELGRINRWLGFGCREIERWLGESPTWAGPAELQSRLDGLALALEQRQQLQQRLEQLAEGEVSGDSLAALWEEALVLQGRRPLLSAEREELLAALLATLNETLPDAILSDFLQDWSENFRASGQCLEQVRSYLRDGQLEWLHAAVDSLWGSDGKTQQEGVTAL